MAFLPLKEALVVTFSETCTPISALYVIEQDIMMPNLLQELQFSGSHSPVFASKK